MAAAFGTLANNGVYIEPEIFTTITTYNGELIIKNTPKTHKVVDPDVAYVITDMLTAVVKEGIGNNAALSSGIPVAGKTGSTNNYLDTWFVGYTPYYVGSTYIGDDAGVKNEDGTIMQRRRIEGGAAMTSSRRWAKIMNRIHQNLEYKTFTKPDNVYMTTINPIDGGRTSYGVLAAFIDGTAPDRYSYIATQTTKKKTQTQTGQQGTQGANGQVANPGAQQGAQGAYNRQQQGAYTRQQQQGAYNRQQQASGQGAQ